MIFNWRLSVIGAVEQAFKKNPQHKKRSGDSWWHKATLIAGGYILARNTSDEWLVYWIMEVVDIGVDTSKYIVENAVAVVALGSFLVSILAARKKKGREK